MNARQRSEERVKWKYRAADRIPREMFKRRRPGLSEDQLETERHLVVEETLRRRIRYYGEDPDDYAFKRERVGDRGKEGVWISTYAYWAPETKGADQVAT